MPFESIRWGLCCQFLDAPIRFRTATHRYVSGLPRKAARAYLAQIARDNAAALLAAVEQCHALGIGSFRINSQLLPLTTHPASGYRLDQVDPGGETRQAFVAAGTRARALDVRLSFHPDQFVVLNSERPDVVASSQEEIEYQAELAELIGADTIVVHGGSTGGGKGSALERLAAGIKALSSRARRSLALENDDRRFTPSDLLPVCRLLGIPLVYDVHHHRCLPDGMSIAQATKEMLETWGEREPYGHLSSPREGWSGKDPRPHAGLIDPADVPVEWSRIRMTVDVEAKEKERAVLAIRRQVSASAELKRAPRRAARSSSPRRNRTTR